MIPLDEIARARETLADAVLRTPLVRFDGPEVPEETELWLKLECLQPIGSFKLRGALNAVRNAPAEAVADGVATTSAGNMAQGVAWAARERGVRATIVVPEHARRRSSPPSSGSAGRSCASTGTSGGRRCCANASTAGACSCTPC